jgi:hypothetical protein
VIPGWGFFSFQRHSIRVPGSRSGRRVGFARSIGVIRCGNGSSRSDDVLLETLLPLGKVDPGLRAPEMPLDLHSIAADARLLEEIGYDGLVVEETKDDPFILLGLAAQATRTLKLGTSVAIAFPAVRP